MVVDALIGVARFGPERVECDDREIRMKQVADKSGHNAEATVGILARPQILDARIAITEVRFTQQIQGVDREICI